MTLCKDASRALWFRTASPTAPRRSASAGSAAVLSPGRSTVATPSVRADHFSPASPRAPSACGRRLELALEMLRKLRNGRMIEQLGQIDEPREIAVDVFVD